MTHNLRAEFEKNRPFVFAAAGFLFGVLFFALLGYDAFGQVSPPITSAFAFSNPAIALIADFAGEAKLFLLLAGLSLLLRSALPALFFLALRGAYFGLSASYLYGAAPLPFYLVYVLLTAAVLVVYAAIADGVLVYLSDPSGKTAAEEERKKARETFGFAFFYFTGVLFLLVIIRNLSYYLLLPH